MSTIINCGALISNRFDIEPTRLLSHVSCLTSPSLLDNLHRDSDHTAILSKAFLIDTVQQQGKLHIDFARFICQLGHIAPADITEQSH